MIRHVVMWAIDQEKLDDGQTIPEVAAALTADLRALTETVPGIRSLTAGPNCVAADGNWDMGLVVDFDNEDDLQAYAIHPAHMDVVVKIRAVVAARAAVDFAL